uniref:Uncharacterized protein n=1 Tax=Arundo donax TaxID=35708 RepID=A0A0A9BDZ7_ARUDO
MSVALMAALICDLRASDIRLVGLPATYCHSIKDDPKKNQTR